MRISDWSSDVCSSDLRGRSATRRRSCLDYHGPGHLRMDRAGVGERSRTAERERELLAGIHDAASERSAAGRQCVRGRGVVATRNLAPHKIGRASGRERVSQYVELSVVAEYSKK